MIAARCQQWRKIEADCTFLDLVGRTHACRRAHWRPPRDHHLGRRSHSCSGHGLHTHTRSSDGWMLSEESRRHTSDNSSSAKCDEEVKVQVSLLRPRNLLQYLVRTHNSQVMRFSFKSYNNCTFDFTINVISSTLLTWNSHTCRGRHPQTTEAEATGFLGGRSTEAPTPLGSRVGGRTQSSHHLQCLHV